MQRMELIECILRLAKTWVRKVYPKKPINEHILEFFTIYIKPIHDESNILTHRRIIRGSAKLNALLFENQKGLEIIFNE